MEFRIADTFTESLAKLTGEEQKAAKTTAFDLQLNPAQPGMKFHRVDGAMDRNFWSVRVSRGMRMIVHKTASNFLLCYVGEHDESYRWAERRRIERHPSTGAAQLVEIREVVRDIEVPRYVTAEPAASPLFSGVADNQLLDYGVPAEWLEDVRQVDDEDALLEVTDHLPAEAAEALVALATGSTPERPAPTAADGDPFAHPDAQRRFRVMANHEELQRALEYPWEKWTVFLHPAQRQMVRRSFHGPARVSGSAGTGKTIVALHRAVHLARTNPDARVLLTTFSTALADALRTRLTKLIAHEPKIAERLEVGSMGDIGRRLYGGHFGRPELTTDDHVRELLRRSASEVEEEHKFSLHFLFTEWNRVVDAWQLASWEQYRDVPRLGRKTRLSERQRAVLWSIFSRVSDALDERGLLTEPRLFGRLERRLAKLTHPPFEFCVVDEAQDIGVAELRFLAALGGARPDGLFFAGDLGQRIFQTPFSWRTLGVDIRGRSQTLKVNYRTSHQIRRQADRLLPSETSDVDGNTDRRTGTVSVFNGSEPVIRMLGSPDEECAVIAQWLEARKHERVLPHEIGLFVRSQAEVERATHAARKADFTTVDLARHAGGVSGSVAVGTMHLAKGMEFRAVAVVACDDEVLPLQSRIESVGDESDLEEVYTSERHLLYVACTRARDHLLVTAVSPASEFLDDLRTAE
jgi:superfamily I DNA/RNA helicase